jgi:hypothetical protein
MKSRLLKSAAPTTINEIAKKRGATMVSSDDVTLNDDLIHPVIIVAEAGNIAGVLIKDLEGDSGGIVIEKNFYEEFLRVAQETWTTVRLIDQDLRDSGL